MKTTYDVNYFIDKFSAIPEEDIGIGSTESHCGYYHCGYRHDYFGDEAYALTNLFAILNPLEDLRQMIFTRINDGCDRRYQQPTPKQRILAALYDIKTMQNTEPPKEISREEKTFILDGKLMEAKGKPSEKVE